MMARKQIKERQMLGKEKTDQQSTRPIKVTYVPSSSSLVSHIVREPAIEREGEEALIRSLESRISKATHFSELLLVLIGKM